MGQEIFQVDAFTAEAFAGNPAGVCVMPEPGDEGWMQSVAGEMNLSETAFLHRREDGYDLRWFTPEVEVDLCGHATLASAHVLWESGEIGRDEKAVFHTRSGVLTASRKGEWIELDFPATPAEAVDAPVELLIALGVEPTFVGKSIFDYLVEVDGVGTEEAVRGVAPGTGVNEDPVTGSAHCTLGPFWQSRLGKSEFLAYQASRRGGEVKVRVAGDRVMLGGQAVTVLRGTLHG